MQQTVRLACVCAGVRVYGMRFAVCSVRWARVMCVFIVRVRVCVAIVAQTNSNNKRNICIY